MARRTGPTNYQLTVLIEELKNLARKSAFWKRVLHDIQKPTRQRRIVNLYKIDKFAKDGETIIVPGKVLSVGNLSKKVTVAAMNFSGDAKEKITSAQGKIMTIEELCKANPEGKKVKILG